MMGILDCRETTRLVSQGLDRELAPGERAALRLHFFICLGCRRTRRQFEFLRKAVRGLGEADVNSQA